MEPPKILSYRLQMRLTKELKAKVGAPGIFGNVVEKGWGDASMFEQLSRVGFARMKMFPYLSVFDNSAKVVLQLIN